MNITSSAYEVNFIGLRSYIHRATKLTSFFTPLLSPICVRLLSQFSCMRNPLVRVPPSIPNGSRDHPEGWAMGFWPPQEGKRGCSYPQRPLSPFLRYIYNKGENSFPVVEALVSVRLAPFPLFSCPCFAPPRHRFPTIWPRSASKAASMTRWSCSLNIPFFLPFPPKHPLFTLIL